MNRILRAEELKIVYHNIFQAIENLTIDIYENKITALLGANGAGKTTILRALSGLLRYENGDIKSGTIWYKNEDITMLSPSKLVAEGIVIVPEHRHVFKNMTIRDNLILGAYRNKGSKRDIEEKMEEVFSLFPKLRLISDRNAGYCSGGEQQMLAIGRGLMARPKVLLLDEPSLGLAPKIVKEIFDKLFTNKNMTIVLVEQKTDVCLDYVDYAYIIESGRITLHGTSEKIKSTPNIQDYYMGIAN